MNAVLKEEFKRKGFHLLLLIYAAGYWHLPKNTVIIALSILIFIVALLELLRFKVPKCNDFFCAHFKGFYRAEEAKKVSALIGTLSGALITIIIFNDRYMVLASFLYLAFGDSSAALIGKSFGKHKLIKGKSVEGSLACFGACFIAGLFLFNWLFALIGAVIASAIEAIPWKISDNFWMQIINAALLTLLSYFIAY
ncbi:MAG: phosphatidate cytidylyltransferase [Elusimicrobiota bacterium]|nr:phosphatidate cytidylyltransferase [Elusimicrobiota bacterium]